uniref:Uncharacterized protein n=1 Tax=Anguilla anguilla TaxID=7936 RepID=A0A0E9XHF1_ANGAN
MLLEQYKNNFEKHLISKLHWHCLFPGHLNTKNSRWE